ncbi:ATP adenylyltransferase [Methylophilaceae bacterium]|nr:ATP adenylyltransferase [Methylophilaceae bacterium]
MSNCELCKNPGGELIWQDAFCRVVLVDDLDYPGFCRVILNRHVKEMSDLNMAERERLMTVVFVVEQVLREIMQPEKINLASLGNMTPHVHWHVIPRFRQDKTFPNPIWGRSRRETVSLSLDADTARRLKSRLQSALG